MKAISVLLVDDDPATREFVEGVLAQNGYEVRLAADGAAALESLAQEQPDVVLLDILMPRKDGLETVLELRQRFPDLKVLAMSVSGPKKRHDFLSVAKTFGADATLQKPFSPDQLLGSLAALGLKPNAGGKS